MIKRVAMIIESSTVKGQKDLPGARLDALNWRSFLTSNIGGAWNDNEIIVQTKPSTFNIQTLLDSCKDSYVFLAFSGHGCEEYDSYKRKYVSKICLNDNEQEVDIDTIFPKQLGTAIFDCCRGRENAQGRIKVANESFAADRTISFSTEMDAERLIALNAKQKEREKIRNFFINKIGSMTTHDSVCMYSCSKGESAGEDVNAGGYYTTLLINGSQIWAEAQRTNKYYAVYTTKQAHDFACIAMKATNPQQHPEYTPDWQSYPFAIG